MRIGGDPGCQLQGGVSQCPRQLLGLGPSLWLDPTEAARPAFLKRSSRWPGRLRGAQAILAIGPQELRFGLGIAAISATNGRSLIVPARLNLRTRRPSPS